MESVHSFGYWVRRQRKALDLTQAALARKVGCAPITIRKIEAEERRPSLQMAARLADSLAISDQERDRFMECARGERPADTLALPSVAFDPSPTLPPWLASSQPESDSAGRTSATQFVGRDAELAWLKQHLEAAQSGEGHVVFITGEAGRGKSMLMDQFARLARTTNPDLLVAVGNCSAYGGQGDPYLPFRDILELLYGDLEAAWRAGRVSDENARRLWRFWPQAVQGLLDDAPGLAGGLIATSTLTRQAASHGLGTSVLAKRLQALQEETAQRSEVRHLSKHFVRLFQVLSAEQPLLLLIDDLQWVDSASLHLLFHLGRRLSGSRVLLLGAYRPADVFPSPAASAYDLEVLSPDLPGVVKELTRRFGDIVISLDRFDTITARRFVDALLDNEPNRLDDAFRMRLFWRTRGHPLFTVELLRELKARGSLLQAADGTWQATESIDWEAMPARIEAVIEQRLARLPSDQRDLLSTASVEGEHFTLELLATVQGIEEASLLDQLARLQKDHRLVREQGETIVGERRMTSYQFRHILFQEYLYRQLSPAQRRHRHGKIAAALEAAGGAGIDVLAVTLAHHFVEAAMGEKAVGYLITAGDQARAVYAHRQAIEHYRRALPFLKSMGRQDSAARTLMKLGLTYHTAFDYEGARRAYEEGFLLWEQTESKGTPGPKTLATATRTLRLNWLRPGTFDPTMAPGLYSNGLASQLFSGLVAITPDLDVLPGVAQRWDVADGGRTYRFRLHPAARWSDEVPVTANDFVFTWKRALHPETRSPLASTLLYDIRGAQSFHQGQTDDPGEVAIYANDAHTLVVELEEPTAYFPHLVAFPALFPVPQHVVARDGARWATDDPLVSNGPFILASRDEDALRLERNPTWHGRFEGNVEQIHLTTLADPEVLWQMYRDDELDILDLSAFPPAIVATARQRYAEQYLWEPQLLTYYLFFNVQRAPFADRRVRLAFALAADRRFLADVALSGVLGAATGGFVPPGMPGHVPNIALDTDVEQARRLLAQAGFPQGRGFPAVECVMRVGRAYLVAPLIAQWRERLGVEIAVHELPVVEAEERAHRGDLSLMLAAWIPDYPDPDCYLRVCLNADSAGSGWRQDEYDELIQHARQLTSQAERMKHYRQAEQILVQEAPLIPILYGRLHLLLKPRIQSFHISPMKQRFWHQVVIER